MKKVILLIFVSGLLALTLNLGAQEENIAINTTKYNEQTVTFTIENMTCKMCDITVRKSMENVVGVIKATVDYNLKTAVVIFDPQKTDIERIGTASTNAGYKATAKK